MEQSAVYSRQLTVSICSLQFSLQSRCYTRTSMPTVDVDAPVIGNVRLSRDYSVLSLAAHEVGRQTKPGQFVMVKRGGVTDPLLRRPFSVFEVMREAHGDVTGGSILNTKTGRSTQRGSVLKA